METSFLFAYFLDSSLKSSIIKDEKHIFMFIIFFRFIITN